jgi:hypothetical protein
MPASVNCVLIAAVSKSGKEIDRLTFTGGVTVAAQGSASVSVTGTYQAQIPKVIGDGYYTLPEVK